MQLESHMKKKCESDKKVADINCENVSKVVPSNNFVASIKATLEKKEKERLANLVERAKWNRKLAF